MPLLAFAEILTCETDGKFDAFHHSDTSISAYFYFLDSHDFRTF